MKQVLAQYVCDVCGRKVLNPAFWGAKYFPGGTPGFTYVPWVRDDVLGDKDSLHFCTAACAETHFKSNVLACEVARPNA